MFPGWGSQWTNPHEKVIADIVDMAKSITSRRLRPQFSSCSLSFKLHYLASVAPRTKVENGHTDIRRSTP